MERFNLLLVCTGNTCRSPMAEALARDLLKDQPGVTVGSAGVCAGLGQPATREAVAAMRALGLDLTRHRSRPLDEALIEAADQIYTMTASHRRAVLEISPKAEVKVQSLDPAGDISDPIGGILLVYKETAEQIRRALEQRLTERVD